MLGDAADAERVKLALVSNIGGKPMTAKDRKRIAQHLYGREWTMARIAETLNVAQSTITEDLRDLSTVDKSKRPKTATNPKGSGRRKGSRSKKKPDPAPAGKEPPPPPAPEPHHAESAVSPIAPPVGQTSLGDPIGSSPETHTPTPAPAASDELAALKVEVATLRAALATKLTECGYGLASRSTGSCGSARSPRRTYPPSSEPSRRSITAVCSISARRSPTSVIFGVRASTASLRRKTPPISTVFRIFFAASARATRPMLPMMHRTTT
jgi:hypothetical protein